MTYRGEVLKIRSFSIKGTHFLFLFALDGYLKFKHHHIPDGTKAGLGVLRSLDS